MHSLTVLHLLSAGVAKSHHSLVLQLDVSGPDCAADSAIVIGAADPKGQALVES